MSPHNRSPRLADYDQNPRQKRYQESQVAEAIALFAARRAARLRIDQTAKALGVHPRTVTRWEIGETRPSPTEWSRLAAFFVQYAPHATVALAAAAGVPSPAPPPPSVDGRMIEAAIIRAADGLDVREASERRFATSPPRPRTLMGH